MSRHSNRPKRGPAGPAPNSPAGRALGLDDRDIPGGAVHIINPETRATPPALEPAAELFADGSLLDHGVPDERPEAGFTTPSGLVGPPQTAAREPEVTDAVPVYMVPGPGHGETEVAAPHSTIVPAPGSTPARLCGAVPARASVLLLNETSTIIRIGATETDAVNGGAALPASMGNYLRIHTKGHIYAIADSGTATLKVSVIEEFSGTSG
ncbi:MAG TPA: hypothetical protein VGV89_07205 [Thermoplasmata archaeon]|nr:hypothetical protein [Thermoplasmata archaeon]